MRGGVLHAFEPVNNNRARLNDNVQLNDLQEVITIWPVGLSSCDGTAAISLREDFEQGGTTGNASLVMTATEQFATETIALRTLDNMLSEMACARIDLIKVDIEGHEDHFLAGARKTLETLRPIVMMEINKPYYARRGVDLDQALPPLLNGFDVLRSEEGRYQRWMPMGSVTECQRLDNVFVVPKERATAALSILNGA